MGKNNTSVLGMIVVFIMIGSFTFTGTNATIIPIINAKIDTGKFYPQPINSINPLGLNDYYIIPTGGNLASQIFYYSNMTGGSNSANYIGGSSTNGETYGATGTTLITDGALLPGSLRTNTTRNGFNPFLPVNDSLPRIVKLNNQNGQHFQTTQVEPFSLHMDYSLTFFADPTYIYTGIVNSTKPFFLDVAVQTNVAKVTLTFGSSPSGPIKLPITVPKMTIPIFPINGTDLQFITIATNQSTVITLTPHAIASDTLKNELMPVNLSYIEEFTQGSENTQRGNTISMSSNMIFSIREFNYSVISGDYYQIYFNFQNYDTCATCSTYLSTSYQFLLGNDYLPISGNLTTTGLTIFAKISTNITLVFVAQGYQDGSYTTYYRNISAPQGVPTIPLQFGKNLNLFTPFYYTFTLTQPAVIAVNFTSSTDAPLINAMKWYMAGTPQLPWVYITTTSNLYKYGLYPSTTGLGAGPLYPSVSTMNKIWAYLPAATYAVTLPSGSMTSTIEFTMAYIQTLSSSITLNMNQNSLYAIELSNLVHNQVNFLNLSTIDRINQTIQYQYVIIDKYFEKLVASNGYTATTIGNKQQNSQWTAFNTNNTSLGYYIPTTPNFDPILIIRPSQAQFLNLSQESSFSATLTVTTNTPAKFFNSNTVFTFPNATTTRLILESSNVASNMRFSINNALTTSTAQLFAIPLITSPNSLYNVTVYLIGNYQNALNRLNATFASGATSVYISGGNLRDLSINFGPSRTPSSNITQTWSSQWILSVSNVSYLYASILRNTANSITKNATLLVTLQKLPVVAMNFGLTALADFIWNKTVSVQEIKSTSPLLTFTLPGSFGTFNGGLLDPGQLLLLGGIVTTIGAGSVVIYLKRIKVKDIIRNVKVPKK